MRATEFLELISNIYHLDHIQRTKLITTLDELPGEPEVYEVIDTAFAANRICPYCSHTEMFRHGLSNGLQRYRCKECKKTFNALTGTPLAHLRQKSKWLDYLNALNQSSTVRKAASNLNVHPNTILRWRHRL
ncbi:hypothetical protein AU255_06310 [Methyloprofundus sedimenti]|uniref:InsA N-terminal zinc ribbon domain-containing protein n=1 Tax=Methyloprofundus sedimenti TaxID=1420851 RepID=A0A1V8M7J1_9GAMM|nr:hypothetical protein AU255_06310 [Methyloprofundus sedimenti]